MEFWLWFSFISTMHRIEIILLKYFDFVNEFIFSSLQIQRQCAAVLQPFFATNGLVSKCLEFGQTLEHIMDYTRLRALGTLFSMLNQSVRNILAYNHSHMDFPMQVMSQFYAFILHEILMIYRLKYRNSLNTSFPCTEDIGRKPTSLAHGSLQRVLAGEWKGWRP